MRKKPQTSAISRRLTLLVILVGLCSAPVIGGSCLSANVPNDFILPDGSTHPAGELRVCHENRLNPRIELDLISVRGASVGLFQGVEIDTESENLAHPVFYFSEKHETGEWILIGMAEPARSRDQQTKSIKFPMSRKQARKVRAEASKRPVSTASSNTNQATESITNPLIAIAAH